MNNIETVEILKELTAPLDSIEQEFIRLYNIECTALALVRVIQDEINICYRAEFIELREAMNL